MIATAVYEVHADLVIIDGVDEEDGDEESQIAKPYVVTLERGTQRDTGYPP